MRRPERARPHAPATLLLIALAAAGGCLLLPLSPAPCETDADCPDSRCTRPGECSATLLAVHLRWTVRGQPASEAACAGVDALRVVFEDHHPPPGVAAEITYQPIPCPLGQISFDRMPARFDTLAVTAHDSRGRRLDGVSLPLQPPEMRIEIELLAEPGPANCRACPAGLFSAAHEHARRGTY